MGRKILFELDKAGAEWVVVAYLTGDARMLNVVESNKKPHLVTGALISSAPEEFVQKEYALIGKRSDPIEIAELRHQLTEIPAHPEWFIPRSMSIYQAGKKSNHGLNYDMGYKRFALENEMEETDASKLVILYREVAYPGIPIWHTTIRELLRRDRTLINCFGRKRIFLDAWGPDLFDAAYAYLPQSTVYDTTREGIVKTHRDKSPLMAELEFKAQTHDSVTFQHPWGEDQIDRIAEIAVKIGLDYMNPRMHYNGRDFQIGTTMTIGFAWGEDAMVDIKLDKDPSVTAQKIREAQDEIYAKAA